jgi:hypothetical protein
MFPVSLGPDTEYLKYWKERRKRKRQVDRSAQSTTGKHQITFVISSESPSSKPYFLEQLKFFS